MLEKNALRAAAVKFHFSITFRKAPQSLLERHESEMLWVAELYGSQSHPWYIRIYIWKIILLQGHTSIHRSVSRMLAGEDY